MNDIPTRIPVAEAQQRIAEICAARRLPAESIGLSNALGRILAADVRAGRDQPPFANSAMDGFAVRGVDLPESGQRRLRLIGTRLAGDPTPVTLGPGECLRITTGAPMPAGADTVVIREQVAVEGSSVVIEASESPGSHVRPAGEDFHIGDMIVRGGQRLAAAHIAALASAGCDAIAVARQPRVRIMTTGDELVMPGTECGPAQIFNSNGHALAALLKTDAIEPAPDPDASAPAGFTHLPDDRARIGSALLAAAKSADVIITSGGVSAGEADHLPGLVAELGHIHFWKVRMRPGMPFLFGEIGRSLVFCLPGNPVSTIATFLCMVRPALYALQGEAESGPRLLHARLAAAITKRHDRTEFLRAVCEIREDGSLWAKPILRQGSSMIRGLVEANALIMVAEQASKLEVGEIVQIMILNDFS